MRTIMLEVSEERFARLGQAAKCRYETLSELLRVRLTDLLADPTEPFGPRGHCRREMDEEFLRRIA